MARARGIEAAPIAAEIEAITHQDWRARTPVGAIRKVVDVFVERAEHDAPDLGGAIDDERPDLVLVDILSFGARAMAEARGLPWAVFCPFPPPFPSPDGPPVRSRPAPGRRTGRAAARPPPDRVHRAWRRPLRPAEGQLAAGSPGTGAPRPPGRDVRGGAVDHLHDRRAVRVPARGHGPPTPCSSAPAPGTRRASCPRSCGASRGRWSWSPPPRSSRTTAGSSRRRSRGWPTSRSTSSRHGPRRAPRACPPRRTRPSSPSPPTRRSSNAPPARSPTAAWARPRRRSASASRSAWSPSAATSSTSPAGRGGRRRDQAAGAAPAPRPAAEQGSGGDRRCAPAPNGWRRSFAAAGGAAAAADALEQRLAA